MEHTQSSSNRSPVPAEHEKPLDSCGSLKRDWHWQCAITRGIGAVCVHKVNVRLRVRECEWKHASGARGTLLDCNHHRILAWREPGVISQKNRTAVVTCWLWLEIERNYPILSLVIKAEYLTLQKLQWMKDWSCASRRGSKHPPKWTQVTAKRCPLQK